MNRFWHGVGDSRSLLRLIAVGTLATLVLLGLSFIPLLIPLLPWWIKEYLVEWIAAALIAGYVSIRIQGKSRRGSVPWVARSIRALDRADAAAGTFLERWLVTTFAGLSILWLLLWIPHYVYWPWCRDADTY